MKLLDCTLRDGGYYTNWDFDEALVAEYAAAMEALPIDYVEVGYRSMAMKGYLGEYFYCPEYVLKRLKSLMPNKKLVIILNEKDIRSSHIDEGLLDPCKPYVTMVRMAIDPKNMVRAIELAKTVKAAGFEVAFNVMYMSNWKLDPSFLDALVGVDDVIDYFYMVDSYGGVLPQDVKDTIALVRSKTNVPIGFHGHDNLEMALINTITAKEAGCEILDATITGMGRGAGNLKTELLLTYLESAENMPIAYNELSNVVSEFEEMRKHYQWGTSLPYMFSGAKSLPQKQVMEWVGMNRYPLGSIINALNNKKQEVADNLKLTTLKKETKYSKAIILGGGKTAKEHKTAVKKFFEESGQDACLIHAGTRQVTEYLDIDCDQYYGLVGFESEKLLKQIGDFSKVTQVCVYPPFPRKMGTTIPDSIIKVSKELERITFTDLDTESPMAIATQIAIDLGVTHLYYIGFDGYDLSLNQNQFVMARENQIILDDIMNMEGVQIEFLTPTKYKNVNVSSIYSLI
ncbi:aldolase catalytic domain-containing protein [Polaribacter sp. Asnod1-A03]|uniref:aldolase catalytic domain-containing protein n=1 Tax=Polaribacter sp. Asnod1-A03 TaxID=3160581 RepID=UPI00386F8573